jgi:hypothetical protein
MKSSAHAASGVRPRFARLPELEHQQAPDPRTVIGPSSRMIDEELLHCLMTEVALLARPRRATSEASRADPRGTSAPRERRRRFPAEDLGREVGANARRTPAHTPLLLQRLACRAQAQEVMVEERGAEVDELAIDAMSAL